MPNTITAMPARPDGPGLTTVPAADDAAQTHNTWAVRRTASTEAKEPWETFLGTLSTSPRRGAMYTTGIAATAIAATFLRTGGSATLLLASAAVAGILAAYTALRAGWRLGCDQGVLDHAGTVGHRAAANTRRAAARRMAFKLPRQPHGEGYLYVLEFSTGYVKVGQSEEPRRRLGQHRAEAAAFGVHVANYWISPSHLNFRDNETRLINACVRVSPRTRKEYFHTVGYDRAVQFAGSLTFYSDNTEQTSVEGVWA